MFGWILKLFNPNPKYMTKKIKISCYCKITGVQMKEILFRSLEGSDLIEAHFKGEWIPAKQIFFSERSYKRFLEKFNSI
jgi:hypothetical protein